MSCSKSSSDFQVKPLMKFKCVSKTWHSTISDPTFITAHLNRTFTKTTHNNTNMVLFRGQKWFGSEENFTLHMDDTDETFAKHSTSTQLNCPYRSKTFHLSIVGYCNGVLCLADNYSHMDDGYALWNPSINKSVSIPASNIRYNYYFTASQSLGFGFDSVNNDFKLVRLVYIQDGDDHFEGLPPFVEIYSLRSGSWRNVTNPAPKYVIVIDQGSVQAFVNGNCHWAARTLRKKGKLRNVIVSFDLKNETFSEMDVPESLVGEKDLNMAVTVLRGSLALVPYYKRGRGRYSVWVMKEYGVAESWTELFDFGIPSINTGGLRFVALRKNGEVLVVTGSDKLLSFDPKNQKFRRFFGIRGHTHSFYMDIYMESFGLLNEANRSDEANAELQEQASSSSN